MKPPMSLSTLRRRLTEALAPLPITTAYLFGSQATGKTGPRSDVDVAILPNPDLTNDERSQLRLDAMSAVMDAVKVDRVDVVPLDDPRVPITLRFNAIQPSIILVDRDRARRHTFEAYTLLRYHDSYFRLKLASRLRRQTLAMRGQAV